jgi:hypothetical protein
MPSWVRALSELKRLWDTGHTYGCQCHECPALRSAVDWQLLEEERCLMWDLVVATQGQGDEEREREQAEADDGRQGDIREAVAADLLGIGGGR